MFRNLKVIISRSGWQDLMQIFSKRWQKGLFPSSFLLLLWGRRNPSTLPAWMGNEIPQVCPWSVLGCLPRWSCLRTPPNTLWHFHELPEPLGQRSQVSHRGFPESLSSLTQVATKRGNLITGAFIRHLFLSVTIHSLWPQVSSLVRL